MWVWIVQYVLIALLICLGIISAVYDIRFGIIPNKIIVIFLICGLVLDTVLYGVLARDIMSLFIINLIASIVLALCFYYTHIFAGGDCKLIIAMSLLYPAGMYLLYDRTRCTLIMAVCIAIFYGFVYLLISSVKKIITREIVITKTDIKEYVASYIKIYVVAMVYVIFTNLGFTAIGSRGIKIPDWIIWTACILIAWFTARIAIFKNRYLLMAVGVLDIIIAIILGVMPISVHPGTYIFTAGLVICQLLMRTNLYETIKTSDVRSGMILSLASSIIMQGSKIKGLPGISSEDLKSRLTDEQVKSIIKWSESSRGQAEICIVKKIPFAVFIVLGYISYFLIWSINT